MLSIILTAPLGAIAISMFGPLLLKKSEDSDYDNPDDVLNDSYLQQDDRHNKGVCIQVWAGMVRSSHVCVCMLSI